MEQIVGRVSQSLAKSIATLRNQIEMRWEYTLVLLSLRAGVKTPTPWERSPAAEITAAISRKKQVFSSAASEGVSGGCNLVFTVPARGALGMIEGAHRPAGVWLPHCRSRTRCISRVLCVARTLASTFFAERVLVTTNPPGFHARPRLAREQRTKMGIRKNCGLFWLSIFVRVSIDAGECPHR